MKKKRLIVAIIVAVLVLAGFATDLPQTTEVVAAKMRINHSFLELEVGQSEKLKIRGTKKKVKWTSTDASVASVNKKGRVFAVGPGSARITARVGRKRVTCDVLSVLNPTAILLDTTSKTLYPGDTFTLQAAPIPDHANGIIEWTSSDPEVATVEDGVVTAYKEGTADIKAYCFSSDASSTCRVTVIGPSISLSRSSVELSIGESTTLTATTDPEGLSVSWRSSDPEVAIVKDGVVKAVNSGKAEITAFCEEKSISAVCVVTVSDAEIKLDKTKADLKIGESLTLTATTDPAGLPVTWESSSDAIAYVKDGKVTAVASGVVTITARIGSSKASCEITVAAGTIELDKPSVRLVVNASEELTATTDPENLSVTWTSSDETVATVNNGVVTGKKEGKATITASILGAEATCLVEVIDASSLFSGGAGTENSPFIVSTAEQLLKVEQFNGFYYIQNKDIDLNYEYVNLFSEEEPFVGSYDGNGYSITNFMYIGTDHVTGFGLFQTIGEGGVVKNLKMKNETITCGNSAGGITAHNMGIIENCSVEGIIKTLTASTKYEHESGMICGKNEGRILSCHAAGELSAKYDDGKDVRNAKAKGGGIAGSNSGFINLCESEADVDVSTVDTDCYAGGIVAYNSGVANYCTARGKINGNARLTLFGMGTGYAGGVAGFNTGTIQGNEYTGDVDSITGGKTGKIVAAES
ncbi:MAG: Ig-like domain-containing protein [Lachnospiraceae bacterium]|nr:Ig-like domain-containing protein [Lachnospiraceae bacterium]